MIIITQNKKAFFNYSIIDKFEAGIILKGSEIKSIRFNGLSLNEAYVECKDNKISLINSDIASYDKSTLFNHESKRPRELLLNRREIKKLIGLVNKKGFSVVPLKAYFNKKNILKLEIATARGKKLYDKREDLKAREWERSKNRKAKDFQ